MANAASKEALANEGKEPDWKGALRILIDTVKAKKDRVSSINGEISAKYDVLEKEGVNKKGARMFLSLDALEASERKDVLRTIEKLGDAAGWSKGTDLVDQAEGKEPSNNVLEMPKPKGKDKAGKGASAETAEEEPTADSPCDPATFKATMVERFCEESDLKEADAYVLANRVFDALDDKKKGALTRKLAHAEAEAEMDNWPEEEPTKQ